MEDKEYCAIDHRENGGAGFSLQYRSAVMTLFGRRVFPVSHAGPTFFIQTCVARLLLQISDISGAVVPEILKKNGAENIHKKNIEKQ